MFRFMAQQSTPTAGLLLALGEGGCGRVCSVTQVPVYLRKQPPRR